MEIVNEGGTITRFVRSEDLAYWPVRRGRELLEVGQRVNLRVLDVNRRNRTVRLGRKQALPSPWESVETDYPVGSVHEAQVLKIMSYGAFCLLAEGLEGLVHICDLHWTRRINHPSELITAGQPVRVKVLRIDREKQEISLGMKQLDANPWNRVRDEHPVGSVVTGTVKNLVNYGAFVEIAGASTG